jgi:hypothetical protein
LQKFREYKDQKEEFEFIRDHIDAEINYMKSLLLFKEKSDHLGALKLTQVLKIGGRYNFDLRRKVLDKLNMMFHEYRVEPTKNFHMLYLKSFPNEDTDKSSVKNFVFVLDYSKSMIYGNKI